MMNPSGFGRFALAQWVRGIKSLSAFPTIRSHPMTPSPRPKIFVMVEGPNDIEFLRRISAMLYAEDPKLPDLAAMERRQELVFIPVGGGEAQLWTFRLAAIGVPELHIYDRDMPPYCDARQRIAEMVNARPGCRAVLTRKRSMENYLHPDAVYEASGLRVEFSDQDDVAEAVALASHKRHAADIPWEALPSRARRRRLHKIKKRLNTRAAELMTPERLAQRDPDGEVRSWLATIDRLANGHR